MHFWIISIEAKTSRKEKIKKNAQRDSHNAHRLLLCSFQLAMDFHKFSAE